MKRKLKVLSAFLAVCAMGAFIGWIGGVQAKTFDAGLIAFFTLLAACMAAVAYDSL